VKVVEQVAEDRVVGVFASRCGRAGRQLHHRPGTTHIT
jgi:hypothetical protein